MLLRLQQKRGAGGADGGLWPRGWADLRGWRWFRLFLWGRKSHRGKGECCPTFRKKTGSGKNERSCSVLRGRRVSWTGIPAQYE